MKQSKSGVRAVLTLFVITGVMAVLLALVNAVTATPIAQGKQEKTQRALSGVLADGVTLGAALSQFPDEAGLVEAVYETSDGYVVEVTPAGYGGEMDLVVGVSAAGEVTGVQIVSHGETSGLGANAAADSAVGKSFRDQFLGASGNLAVTKDGGTVEALTGATVTSRAVTRGINAALACAAALEGGSAQ